jgi:hypothetical protein
MAIWELTYSSFHFFPSSYLVLKPPFLSHYKDFYLLADPSISAWLNLAMLETVKKTLRRDRGGFRRVAVQ